MFIIKAGQFLVRLLYLLFQPRQIRISRLFNPPDRLRHARFIPRTQCESSVPSPALLLPRRPTVKPHSVFRADPFQNNAKGRRRSAAAATQFSPRRTEEHEEEPSRCAYSKLRVRVLRGEKVFSGMSDFGILHCKGAKGNRKLPATSRLMAFSSAVLSAIALAMAEASAEDEHGCLLRRCRRDIVYVAICQMFILTDRPPRKNDLLDGD
jgi:hypothetical protein